MSLSSYEKKDLNVDNDKDQYAVVLEPSDDPQNLSKLKKWIAVLVISSASLCVTCASSIVSVCPQCQIQ